MQPEKITINWRGKSSSEPKRPSYFQVPNSLTFGENIPLKNGCHSLGVKKNTPGLRCRVFCRAPKSIVFWRPTFEWIHHGLNRTAGGCWLFSACKVPNDPTNQGGWCEIIGIYIGIYLDTREFIPPFMVWTIHDYQTCLSFWCDGKPRSLH